jgi:transcriptional regulator with XRE-family HTH domain
MRRRIHAIQLEWDRALERLMKASRDCKTQMALARKSGVGQSTIGRILRGDNNQQTNTMTFLANALGMSFQRFAAVVEDQLKSRR